MGILRHYQRAALALIAAGVITLYGAAIAFPTEHQQKAAVEWVALPSVAPVARTTPTVANPPGLDEIAAVKQPRTKQPRTTTVAELHDKFSAVSFELGAVRHGGQPVPRLFADALPHDLKTLGEVGKLKQTFFQMVLPLTLKVNEEILADRHRLVLIQKELTAGRALSGEQQEWLDDLAVRYDAASSDGPELLRRVDAISPALALAQSAEESGWGRSRFALKGNALFGQRTWDKGLGIVPQQRDDDGRYEVRAFSTLLDSVRSYARNLNGHPAYGDFRARRAEMRARDATLDPYGLIETLTAYSERRGHYVQTIQKILRVDSLEELEDTRLEGRSTESTQVLSRS
jgi:Bax protein